MARTNQCWVFARRPGPEGLSEMLFELKECPLPEVGPGQALVASYLFSLDPTIRNALAGPKEVSATSQEGRGTYYSRMNWQPGEVPKWTVVGIVLESQNEKLPVGSYVSCPMPWQRYSVVEQAEVLPVGEGVTAENCISMLGLTGMTAVLPIDKYAKPKAGETAFVSGAAGAVGSTVCQLLLQAGCHVVGSAGSDEKVDFLKRLGVKAFNYKKVNYLEALQQLCPKGVDIYYDNVGAEALEATLEVMNDYGRVIACGAISQYDTPPEKKYGVKNLFHVIGKRLLVQGFLAIPGEQFSPQEFAAGRARLAELLRAGKLVDQYTALEGFERLPQALCGLFRGD
eukprot:EG_transcript_18606